MNQKRKILVVDDVTINRNILSRILNRDGFMTEEADNGQAALDIILREKKEISLILLDLTMPVMDGFAFLDKMKEAELLGLIPVIVTTGNDQNDAEIRSLEHGATDFITKPYKPDVVCHRVRSILRLCENAALLSRVETDRLTGVYSREFFYQRAEALLDAHPDEQYDVICSNIENFKMINSKYGIEVADELLKSIAVRFMNYVAQDGVCGRLGADVFVLLCKHIDLDTKENPDYQENIGKRLMLAFKDTPVKNFVIQFGIYQVTGGRKPISDMYDFAQLALTSIKHKYGFYYAVYNDSMRQKLLREHELSDHMEQALIEKQFLVYLQPKHDIKTEAVAGAEALVRWIHPELGFISPGEFIPLFERNGFITKLDWYIWEEVCRLQRQWMDEGRNIVPVSVNASRADFAIAGLPERIDKLVEKYQISPKFIHFEVTESAYTENPKQIINAVSTLRDMGFKIEMDDFGSGYSSLNMLSELPIDILKLDMRFVQNQNGLFSSNKRSILSFIVSLSKWLQLPTIAEGVETKEDVDLLKSMGCNYIQGYYYAKPMPVKEFVDYMVSHRKANSPDLPKSQITDINSLSASSGSEKRHVLIVEDIDSNRDLLKQILEPYYIVDSVCNGKEAYQYIAGHHNELSCILLDLLMPVMDGFQLMDLLRKEGFLAELPVVITSEDGGDGEVRALRLGADGFVRKPYNPEILLHHVKKAVDEWKYRKLTGTVISQKMR